MSSITDMAATTVTADITLIAVNIEGAATTMDAEMNETTVDTEMVDVNIAASSGTENSSQPLTEFYSFPKLAAELQLKIWEFAVPGPRVIKFKPKNIITGKTRSKKTETKCEAIASIPIILHVCHDSRQVGLKFYSVSFEQELIKPIYFDPKRDVIQFAFLKAAAVFLRSCKTVSESKIRKVKKCKKPNINSTNIDTNSIPGAPYRFISFTGTHDQDKTELPHKQYAEKIRSREVITMLGNFENVVVIEPVDLKMGEYEVLKGYRQDMENYFGLMQEFYAHGRAQGMEIPHFKSPKVVVMTEEKLLELLS